MTGDFSGGYEKLGMKQSVPYLPDADQHRPDKPRSCAASDRHKSLCFAQTSGK